MVKQLLKVFLLILSTGAGLSQQSSGEDNFSRLSKSDQLAVLGERYHELGRFSGTILI
jgi:hypothetical protein